MIPKRKKITEIHQLSTKDQKILITEIVYVSKLMKKIFKAFNINVEKIGNIVPQLHIHIIARSKKDSSWPLSVWVVKNQRYLKKDLEKILLKFQKNLMIDD